MFAAILLIAASISILVAIFILQKRYHFTYMDWGVLYIPGDPDAVEVPNAIEVPNAVDGPDPVEVPDSVKASTARRLRQLDYGAKLLTGISVFFFVPWIEHTMWPYPYAETFAVIGQWGQLISTLLVLAFAGYKYILTKIRGLEREPPPPPRSNRAPAALALYRRLRRRLVSSIPSRN
jgi:hypothetical protein